MTDARGYIYLLSNPAMPRLVKIGKTRRHPVQRAEELSSATGVPAPFSLTYFIEVANCDTAETWAHNELTAAGMRESNRREFFRCDVHEAVELLVRCRTLFGQNAHTRATTGNAETHHTAEDVAPVEVTAENLYQLAVEAETGGWTIRPNLVKASAYFELAATKGHDKALLRYVDESPRFS